LLGRIEEFAMPPYWIMTIEESEPEEPVSKMTLMVGLQRND
jgi:hypothetical protein